MARIWVVTKNPGGHNAVSPVSECLKLRRHSVLDVANGEAVDIMNKKLDFRHFPTYLRSESLDAILDLVGRGQLNLPDVFVTSTCSNGGVGRDLIPEMKKRNVPTVAVTDFWTGAQIGSFLNSMYWPDAVCVQDNLARDILLGAWHGYPDSSVYVTGQPAFDKLASFNKGGLLERYKNGLVALNKLKKFGMPDVKEETFDKNTPTVLFAGQLKGTAQALNALIISLNMLSCPVNLVVSYHPRLSTDSPEEERPIHEAESLFRNGKVIPTYPLSSDEWSCVADLVVSMTSTVLATAGHFRKDCISILFPETERNLDARYGLPYERLGTAEVVRSKAMLNTFVAQSLLKGGLGLRDNQEKHFVSDGNSAKRVADVVENTLNVKQNQ